MKITPTLEECKNIAAEGSYGVIPISTELYADMTTPIEVLRILKKVSGHVYLLESATIFLLRLRSSVGDHLL